MSTPYTYVVTCPDGRRYYGVRFARGCDPSDLWVTYFTSSRHIRRMIEQYGKQSFTVSVRRIFDNRDRARDWEQRVLQRLKVRRNARWVNVTHNRSRPVMEGESNPSKRPEVRRKISEAKRGRPRPDARERMKTNHPMHDPETRERMKATRRQRYEQGEITGYWKGKQRPEMVGAKHPRYGKKAPKLSDANRIERTCPHCGKIGKGPGMLRYHFDRCGSYQPFL